MELRLLRRTRKTKLVRLIHMQNSEHYGERQKRNAQVPNRSSPRAIKDRLHTVKVHFS